jgi:hypothetical protein
LRFLFHLHSLNGHYDEPEILSYAIPSICPIGADVRQNNTSPYSSATHGQRFVNNYANGIASSYGKHEEGGILPAGSIVAKDSFLVSTNGDITVGPLFLMEKMEKGFNYVSGDWRYTMIMPDGSIFGVTKGTNAGRVQFCIGCHLAREATDHLFYAPKAYRVN